VTPDPESTDCLLWIFDSSFERLLLSQGAAGATLPGVTVESGNYPHVAPVLDATRRRLGLDITVLRCLADRGPGSDGPGPREYSAFCRCPTMTLAHGLQWAPVREAEAKLSASARTRGAGPVFDSETRGWTPGPRQQGPVAARRGVVGGGYGMDRQLGQSPRPRFRGSASATARVDDLVIMIL